MKTRLRAVFVRALRVLFERERERELACLDCIPSKHSSSFSLCSCVFVRLFCDVATTTCAHGVKFFLATPDDERFQIVLEFTTTNKPTLTVAFETIEELKEWAEAFENATEALTTPPPAEVFHR